MTISTAPPGERTLKLSQGECDAMGIHHQPEGVEASYLVKGRVKNDGSGNYELSVGSVDKAPKQEEQKPVLVQNTTQPYPS